VLRGLVVVDIGHRDLLPVKESMYCSCYAEVTFSNRHWSQGSAACKGEYIVVVVLRELVVVDIGHRDPLPIKQIIDSYIKHRQRSPPAKPNHLYSFTGRDTPPKCDFCASN
jgi:hypothetical protein